MEAHEEMMRPQFEQYIRSERPAEYLERTDARLNTGRDYTNLFVQEAWEAWRAALKSLLVARTGPRTTNNDMVICPTCTSQFTAIPVNIQSRLAALEQPPAIPVPSHVHCQCCGDPNCPGVRVREALPLAGPSPEQVRRIRMEGRNEALELLTNMSAEKFIDDYFGERAIADTGDYDVHWETDKLRELLEIGEYPESLIDRLEASYWTQQAFIDGLQVQLSEEWLPIEAAGGDKDGRYILGWFEHDPMYKAFPPAPDEPGPPWVAAVRYSGNDLEGWSMKGIGGLFPTKFRRITGPDGKPVGYIRPPGGKAP